MMARYTVEELLHPILNAVRDGRPHEIPFIRDYLAKQHRQLQGDSSVWESAELSRLDLDLAINYLVKLQLISRIDFKTVCITSKGTYYLQHSDAKTLQDEYRGFQSKSLPQTPKVSKSNKIPPKVARTNPYKRVKKSGPKQKLNRTALFRNILLSEGNPLHYREIHQRALTQLTDDAHFSPNIAYVTLYTSRQFRSFGNGLFGLSEWREIDADKIVFTNCPKPLLPVNASKRSLFDGVIYLLERFQNCPSITVRQIMTTMQQWSKRHELTKAEIQSAFDAWYVLGIISFITDKTKLDNQVHFELKTYNTVEEVRIHCLNSMCQRLKYTSMLLEAIHLEPRATVAWLESIIPSSSEPVRIGPYLRFLETFEAIQCLDGNWRLTTVAEAILTSNPSPIRLEFSTGESRAPNADNLREYGWEIEYGLLDV